MNSHKRLFRSCLSRRSRGWLAFVCLVMISSSLIHLHIYRPGLSSVLASRSRLACTSYFVDGYYQKQEAANEIRDYQEVYDPAVDSDNISYAYDKNWVGFPELKTVDCHHLLSYVDLKREYRASVKRRQPVNILADTRDCKSFVEKFGFNRYPTVSQEERDFPIAFSLLFHMDIDQVLFLLRAIYRPHNVYCLSVDTKSSVEFLEATISVTRCLPNVFVSSKLENIVYAGVSRLMADLHCFQDLLKHSVPWRYVINQPGQSFPLRTNLELVKILKLYNGTNDVESSLDAKLLHKRHELLHMFFINESTGTVHIVNTLNKYDVPPPHRLEIMKCSAYGAFTRAFVEYVLTNQVAKDLLEWSKYTFSPDEMYWATLNYNRVHPVPGGFKGIPRSNTWLTSFSVWDTDKKTPCKGGYVRGICIFMPGDLPLLMKRHELFANKFYITYYPTALHCLDQVIYNTSFYKTSWDMAYYQNLSMGSRSVGV